MPKLDVYSLNGEKKGTVELVPSVFAAPVSSASVHQVVVAMQANARNPYAHSKTRGFIRGGGRKPWRQKGTGNARAGSIRSPLWRGGGITFGPSKQRNFTKKIPRTLFQKSLKSVLSDKIGAGLLYIVEDFNFNDAKTKILNEKVHDLKKMLGIKAEKVLIVTSKVSENLKRSVKNLPTIAIIDANSISPLNLLLAPAVIMVKDVLPLLEKRLTSKKA